MYPYLLISRTESSAQTLDSSSDAIKLRRIREQKDSLEMDFSAIEVTHQSMNEHTKLATEPIFR